MNPFTDLTVGVNLGSDRSILVKSIFASNGKVGSSSNSAGAGDSSLQLGVVLQIDTTSKHLNIWIIQNVLLELISVKFNYDSVTTVRPIINNHD